jgi:hypothetical protein
MTDEKPIKVKKPRTEAQLAATAKLVAANKERRAAKLAALEDQVKEHNVKVTPHKIDKSEVVIIKKKKTKKSEKALNIIEENVEKPIEKPIEKKVKPKAVKKVKAPPVPKIKPDHIKKDKPKKKVERANLIKPMPQKPPPSESDSDSSALEESDYEYTAKEVAKYTKEALGSDASGSDTSSDDEPVEEKPIMKKVKVSHEVLEAGKGNKKSRFF